MTLKFKTSAIPGIALTTAILSLPACAMHQPAVTRSLRATVAAATTGTLTVKVDQPGVQINPKLYGLMTEEINHSYDGGLYGELIRNRAFKDDANNPAHWSVVSNGGAPATIALDNSNAVGGTALTTSLRLEIPENGRAGVANEGYWGIPVKPNTSYTASFYARASEGFNSPVTVSIETNDGSATAASAELKGITSGWKKYTITLKTGNVMPSTTNRFVISATQKGTLWFSQVSLFPPTFKNRKNGNRIDLMEKMGAMNPSFLRMPGGNYLEGNKISERFEWKDTIGPIENRPGHWGPWGYRSTDGFGLDEFLGWCDDLKMEPILAVFAGYALGGEHVDAGPQLEPYVQDALDEIEYLIGDTNTKWGAERAKNGHPKPYSLTYVEIGNEDWFDRSGSYDGRYAQFHNAIKAKYPKLQIIATMPVKNVKPDLVDEHYYRSASDMIRDVNHYDKYDRTGPKIFVGEWASTEGNPTPTMQAAIGDAVWMTGMERNSDIVPIECYAPLLVNVNPRAAQWGTNLIGYDALNSFGSPSYYVQAMFGNNRGDVVLPVDVAVQDAPPPPAPAPKGGIGVGTWATQAEYKDIDVTVDGNSVYKSNFAVGNDGWQLGKGTWSTADGALRQTGNETDSRATKAGDAWGDYTYHVKARKVSGDEGFLIIFHYKDANNFGWWNLGGWGNTRSAFEVSHDGARQDQASKPVTIETGKWYDIAIELHGTDIKGYIDGKLVAEAKDEPAPPAKPIYATASRDKKSGDVIVKVVNTSADAQKLTVNLDGANDVSSNGTAVEISGDPATVNSVAEPAKVAPKTMKLTGLGKTFDHSFPAHSVTVLRVKAK